MMKKRRADIIQVPKQCEEAAPKFVIPNLRRQKFNPRGGCKCLGLLKDSPGFFSFACLRQGFHMAQVVSELAAEPTMTLNY